MSVCLEKCKRRLRAEIAVKIAAFTEQERREMNKRICENVLSMPDYRESGLLLTYVSAPSEVDTLALIGHALASGKTVAVPKCAACGPTMEFYIIRSLDELHVGRFSLLEPDSSPANRLGSVAGGFCVVPGLCFDRAGNRLGHGEGFYDRFLADYGGFTAGLCYDSLVYEGILPAGVYDVPVRAVVTDREICKTAGRHALAGNE